MIYRLIIRLKNKMTIKCECGIRYLPFNKKLVCPSCGAIKLKYIDLIIQVLWLFLPIIWKVVQLVSPLAIVVILVYLVISRWT